MTRKIKIFGLSCIFLLVFMIPTICFANETSNTFSPELSTEIKLPDIKLTPIDIEFFQYHFAMNGQLEKISDYGIPTGKTDETIILTNEQFQSMFDELATFEYSPSAEDMKSMYADYYEYYQDDYTEEEYHNLVKSLEEKNVKCAIKNGPNITIIYPTVITINEVEVNKSLDMQPNIANDELGTYSIQSIYTQTDEKNVICLYDGQASSILITATFNKEPGVYTFCDSAWVENRHHPQYSSANLVNMSTSSIYYSRTWPSQSSCYTTVSFDYWTATTSHQTYNHTFVCSLN